MKNVWLSLLLLVVGCGSQSAAKGGDDDTTPDAPVQVVDANNQNGDATDASTGPADAMVCTANTQNDSHNCGACGRSCLGNACSAGRCVADRLDNNDITGIGDFTADAVFVYYTGFTTGTGTNHRLWRRAIGATTAGDYLTVFSNPTPMAEIAFDGSFFYSSEPNRVDTVNRGQIKQVAKSPFAQSDLANLQPPTMTAIFQQGTSAYWATDIDSGDGGDIKKTSIPGGAIDTITALAGRVFFLTGDTHNLYWVDNALGGLQPALRRAPIAGGATVSIASGTADFIDMDATNVYVLFKNTGDVVSVDKSNDTPTTIAHSMTAGVAVDGQHVYAAKTNQLVGLDKTGNSAGVLWEGAPEGTMACPVTMKITRVRVIGAYVYALVVPTDCNNVTTFNRIYRTARL